MPTSYSIESWKPSSIFRGLFLSKSGDGKSTAAASFPEPYEEMDTDLRFGGIVDSWKQGFIKNKKISYTQFPPLTGWTPIGEYLAQLIVYRMQHNQNIAKFPFQTMGLGSLGSLERILLNLAREKLEGRVEVGGLKLSAPGDQKVANSGVHQVLDTLFNMPCNIIATGHLIDKWGKPKAPDTATKSEANSFVYKPNEVIGERINLNDNLAESIASRFDNVFKFDRETKGTKIIRTVEFSGDLSKNSYGIPPGWFDWTGKDFYEYFMKIVEIVNGGTREYGKIVEKLK